jgi:hypothetical protein
MMWMVFLNALLMNLMLTAAIADDYLPVISTVTGREIGRVYRTDGASPTKTRAETDKRACLLDPQEVPNTVSDRLSALARNNREAAEIEIAKVVIPCMG